ncbi:MAG: 4Fe-4S binding protein [Candidatus Cloacimonetes bacterium]|nr:4Fe-4S binding protein [Candidatus Cloacimonadota bacterium]
MNINHELCDTCGTCVAVCPTLALKLDFGKLIWESDLCTSCGVCVLCCPVSALEITNCAPTGD